MKTKAILSLLTVASLTSSCGEIGVSYDDLVQATTIEISTHEVKVWEGDSYAMSCEVQPQGYDGMLYWFSDDDDFLTMVGRQFTADNIGEVWVYVKYIPIGIMPTRDLADDAIYDRCRVEVFNWAKEDLSHRYAHSMVYYAAVTVDGETLPDEVELGALTHDGSLRGFAHRRHSHGIDYIELRIFGQSTDDGLPLSLWLYDHRDASLRRCEQQLVFSPMQTHGTLSDLHRLELTVH